MYKCGNSLTRAVIPNLAFKQRKSAFIKKLKQIGIRYNHHLNQIQGCQRPMCNTIFQPGHYKVTISKCQHEVCQSCYTKWICRSQHCFCGNTNLEFSQYLFYPDELSTRYDVKYTKSKESTIQAIEVNLHSPNRMSLL